MSEYTEEIRPDGAHVLRLPTQEEVRARRAQRDSLNPVADQIVRNAVSAYEDLTPVRADLPGGVFSRLNPGELEEIEARLKAATGGPWTIYTGHTGIRNTLPYAWVGPEVEQRDGGRKIAPVVERANGGTMADMRFIAHARVDVEKLINTINALSRRVTKRFNETAQARQDAAAARERAERAEAALKARGSDPTSVTYGWPENEAGRERLEREVNRLTAELYQARTKVEEYGRDAMRRTRVVDKIRLRFGIAPEEDLYEGLSRKVGDLQTSEAELVSAPLRARISTLVQSVQARDRLLDAATRRVNGLEQLVQDRDRLLDSATREREEARQALKARETEVRLLEVALGDWRRAGEKIASAVFGRRLDQVMNVARHMAGTDEMITAINDVRAAIARMKPSGS